MEQVLNKIGELVYKPLESVKSFQGELKELTKESYEKLKTSFLRHGNIAPIFTWKDNILDGHQRIKTLLKIKEEGTVNIPDKVPCVEIKAKDKKQAKRFLLQYISQQGHVTEEGLYEYLHSAGLEADLPELKMELDIPGMDLDGFEEGWFKEGEIDLPDGDKGEFQQITFTLHDLQYEKIINALDIVKQKNCIDSSLNKNSNANAITYICEGFINTNG